MPTAPARPCRHPGCSALVRDGSGRCAKHPAAPGSFADPMRGSRHERGYGTEWDKKRKRILRRDKGLCQPCLEQGRPRPARQVDHIVNKAEARARGWTEEQIEADENLQSICDACHKAKTAEEARRGRGV